MYWGWFSEGNSNDLVEGFELGKEGFLLHLQVTDDINIFVSGDETKFQILWIFLDFF